MSLTPTSRQTVLEEVFDENSKPSYEEIKDYGVRIGVDLDKEPNLYDLARDGLMQPLPSEWKPVRDNDTDQIYYFNFKTKESQWEHPLDSHYRNLVQKQRISSLSQTDNQDDDSRTSMREDLKSYEEAVSLSLKQQTEMFTTPLPPRGGKLAPLTVGAIKKTQNPPSLLGGEVKKRPNSSDIRNRRNIGPVEFRHLSKQDIMKTISKYDDKSKDEGYGTELSFPSSGQSANKNVGGKKELTLTGGGSAFLKNKTKTSPSNDVTSPSLSDGHDDGHRRGILREQKSISGNDVLSDKKDDNSLELDEDRKSVRFNLEKELKIKSLSENSCTDDESITNSEHKQIEIDFEELEKSMKQQEEQTEGQNQKTQNLREMFERKAINIQLNRTYEQKNLIDLSDDSSTVDSQKPTPRSDSNVQKMKSLFEGNVTRRKMNKIESSRSANDGNDEEDVIHLLDCKSEMKYLEDLEKESKLRQKKFRADFVVTDDKINEITSDDNKLEINLKEKKENELNFEYDLWFDKLKNVYAMKKQSAEKELEEKYKEWMKEKEVEMLTRSETESQTKLNKLLEEVRCELVSQEVKEVEKLKKQLESEQSEKLKMFQIEIETKQEQDLTELKKNCEEELLKKKEEIMERHRNELMKIEMNLENVLSDQRCQKILELDIARENEAAIEVMRLEMKENYQKQKNNLTKEHETLLENLRQQHVMTVEQMKIDLRAQEEALRKSHQNRLEELKTRLNRDVDKKLENADHTPRSDVSDTRVYEKVRCEKRLLEDKYKSLKEKYIKLKTDVKLTLDKKQHKKDGATTGSETEKSTSHKMNTRKYDEERKVQQQKLKKQMTNMEKNVLSGEKKQEQQKTGTPAVDGETTSSEDGRTAGSKRRKQLLSKLKAASTSKLNGNLPVEQNNDQDETLSPVESLRRQLRKLEEIEDQFPVATHADTYLRYPFTESTQFGSSELEFFRHRIHLERDSVRRAKEFLKAQKKCFENRQVELKQRMSESGPRVRGVVEQIYQEEKELTDMEVSVHRTRSLLGEKIIRLRHLEHSLRRLSRGRSKSKEKDDGTLSDLSSHSGSSGFSSTDFNNSDVVGGAKVTYDQNRRRFETNMQESSEIIHSLENLNMEIKEIWEVLKKQHQSGQGGGNIVLPPPPLVYTDLGWSTHPLNLTANLHRPLAQQQQHQQQYMTQVKAGGHVGGHVTTTVVDSSLVERTRSLRNWLRTARNNGTTVDLLSAVNQVTL